jgi:hypothetical protein
MAAPRRPRKERREQERALRKNVRATERLAKQLPGATPENPIDVASASVVEIQARATPCPQCGGTLDLRGERADSTPRGVLREIRAACRLCRAPRTLWFRIALAAAN